MGVDGVPVARGDRGSATGPAFFAVVALGVLSLGLLLWADGLWRSSFRKTVPLLDNLMQAKDSLAEGHVWLEELLRGNRTIETDMVSDAYDQAVAAVEDSLAGRSAIENLSGIPPDAPALVAELKKYRLLSSRARDVARSRWERAAQGQPVETPDLQLLSAFHALGLVARQSNARLQSEIRGVLSTQTRLRDLTLALWSALLAGASCALFVAGRRRVLAEQGLVRAHADLERKVEERTAELTAANARLRSEVEERSRAQEALARSESELRSLSSRLLAFQEDERARLARELHDGIAQNLVAVKYRIESSSGDGRREGVAAEEGGSAAHLLQGTLDDVRRIYTELRPSLLDDLGLLATVEWLCRRFREAFPVIRVECEWGAAEADVPDSLKIVLFRLVQECLNNVAQHSGARWAAVYLRRLGTRLELSVEDDGVGFDAALGTAAGEECRHGIVLGSMRHRAESSGGVFSVESAPGGGTLVSAVWTLIPDPDPGTPSP